MARLVQSISYSSIYDSLEGEHSHEKDIVNIDFPLACLRVRHGLSQYSSERLRSGMWTHCWLLPLFEKVDDDTELKWVQGVLYEKFGITDVTLDAKYSQMTWFETDDQAHTYAIDFKTYNPEFFLVKIGNGSLLSPIDHFLFQNTPELAWGVVNLADLGITEIIGLDRISHVDEFNGGAPVPEPATMLLLGSGLLGLAGFRKKFKN